MIRGWLSQGGFRRDATVLFTTTALARGVLLIAMPLVARYFVPEDVGTWQLFVSLGTVIGTIVCLRYEVAIPLPSEDKRGRELVGASMLVALGMAALLCAVTLLFRGLFSRFVATPALDPYLWYLPLMAVLIGCEQTASYWLTRTGDFTTQGISRLLKSGFSVALPLGFAVLVEARLDYLIIGTVLGQLAGTLVQLRRNMWPTAEQAGGAPLLSRLRSAMREYKSYPLYVAPYAFVGQFAKRLVYFLLASHAGASAVGYFAMAMQITYLPVGFVSGALNQAFYRRASQHSDLRELEPLVVKVLHLQVVLATAPFALLVLHAPFVLRVVLGPGWDETAHYLMWLAPASLLAFVSGWLDRMLDKLGQQRLAVILQLCYDALSLGLLIALLASGHSAITSIAAYCLASTVYCGVWLLVAFQRAGYALASLGKLTALASALVAALVAVHMLVGAALAQPWALLVETLLALALQFLAWRYTRVSFALSRPPTDAASLEGGA